MHENGMENHDSFWDMRALSFRNRIYVHFSLNSISSNTIESSNGWQNGDEEIGQVGGERVGA